MTTTEDTANATVVRTFLQAFAAGDVASALSCFAEDCVVDEAHGLPFSGRYVGTDGFLELLGKMSARLDARVDTIEVIGGRDAVVGRIGLTFTGRTSGRELPTTAVEIYTVRGGRIVHADVYYKDPAAVSELADGA